MAVHCHLAARVCIRAENHQLHDYSHMCPKTTSDSITDTFPVPSGDCTCARQLLDWAWRL